jgi:Tol biopolymer transport system component
LLNAGAKLGPYQIIGAIGAGGMGEVYRARDTRLDRTVAIKVLPTHLADRSELRERFEREARTIASLNHPHICTLHDIGQQDGIDYLVMEYLEGETLAHRLLKGSLPLEQVLQYAIEISDALDKAHRKGVTHRDLKPGNIILTKTGTKLLDFGLAKLKQEVAPANVQLSELPTASDPLTAKGTIVGTLQYMAPEQLEGKEVDARTDIFAFGAVVYEMATGKRAFEGKSQASLIAKILETDPPPMSSLQPMTPPALGRVVKKCLAKEPEKRWQAASDVCDELKWIAEGGSQAGSVTPLVAQRKSRERLAWSVAVAVLVAALALGAFEYLQRAPQGAQTTRFFVSPPEARSLAGFGTVTSGSAAPLSVSPDGRRIVFVAGSPDGKYLLWVRSLDTLTGQALAGTEGASAPFWSPDGATLGFFAGGKLKKIDVSGGPATTLCDAPDNRGGTWSRDGVIVFNPGNRTALQKVSTSGGVTTAATVLGQGEVGHYRPSFLPDGRHFLYRASTGSETSGPIYLGSLDSAERKLLLDADASNVVYTQGHLLFLRETTLMAQPFDPRRLALTSSAFPIAEQIQTQGNFPPSGVFSASENGVLAYQAGTATANSQLVWFDRTGKQIGMLGDPAEYGGIELSPDGRQASVSIPDEAGKGRDIWVYDVARGLRTRFTFDRANELASIWSPDGSRVVFDSDRKGHLDLYQKASSGAGAEEMLLEDSLDKYPESWSPDGQSLAFHEIDPAMQRDIWVLRMGDASPGSGEVPSGASGQARKAQPFLRTRFDEASLRFSPDGRWLAYISNETGRYEIYVQPYPGPGGGKWQISTEGGTEPVWNPNGRELFYRSGGKMMAVDIATQPSFAVGKARMLFEGEYVPTPATLSNYDVSPDGQRFLMLKPIDEAAGPTQINVVLNCFEELKRRVPAGAK